MGSPTMKMFVKLSIRSLLLKALIFGFCVPAWAGMSGEMSRMPSLRSEVGFGLAGSEKSTGQAFLLRGVKSVGAYNFGFGYLNLYNQRPNGMKSDHASLPTLNVEVTRVIPANGADLSIGGGLGFTMPNLAGGVNEQADNDVSFTAVGAFTKHLSRKYDLSISVRGFFFNTDSQLTTYGSHFETLSTGQAVEVVDEFHADQSLRFNSVIFMASLLWG